MRPLAPEATASVTSLGSTGIVREPDGPNGTLTAKNLGMDACCEVETIPGFRKATLGAKEKLVILETFVAAIF